MSRQSIENRHLRKIGKTGNSKSPSYFVTIPKELIIEMGLASGREVSIKRVRNRLVIEKSD